MATLDCDGSSVESGRSASRVTSGSTHEQEDIAFSSSHSGFLQISHALPAEAHLAQLHPPNPRPDAVLPPSGPALEHVNKDQEARSHLHLIPRLSATDTQSNAKIEEIKTTPLFTHRVRMAVEKGGTPLDAAGSASNIFQQYGLLGVREETYSSRHPDMTDTLSVEQNLVYANMNAPWSAFICGSQGAGKSHSLSCLLENSLLTSSLAGQNPKPLAGLVFHYDKFTSHESTQLCEAAYLCSAGVRVRILVSPSNIHAMRKLYRNLPGLSADAPRPEVIPLYFQEHQLNVSRLMTLMAVNGENGVPLYMEVLFKILRDMSTEKKGEGGMDYLDFKHRLESQAFTFQQKAPLSMRLALLESLLAHKQQSEHATARLNSLFNSAQGTLTIVDLSCPFVNENNACALFTICLSLFMENRGDCGRVIALDEAHKFLTESGEAEKLTEQLTSIVRQQRHLATRIIIATQEPTLAPSLLDLCNVSIVHRFNSPAWFEVLRRHLAGARLCHDRREAALFETIVGLKTGQALVFCPSAMLDISDQDEVRRLNDAFIRIRIRSRVTADGGRSILASDEMQRAEKEDIPAEELIVPFNAGMRPPNPVARPARSTSNDRDDVSMETSSPAATDDSQSSVPNSATGSPSEDQDDESAGASSSAATDDTQPSLPANAAQGPSSAARSAPKKKNAARSAASRTVVASRTPTVAAPVSRSTTPTPRPRRAPTSAPTSTSTIRPRTSITQGEARSYLHKVVASFLKGEPQTVRFSAVCKQAAKSAGLPEGFFESSKAWKKWSRLNIHELVDEYVERHQLAPPTKKE